jgi:hypothetical protein
MAPNRARDVHVATNSRKGAAPANLPSQTLRKPLREPGRPRVRRCAPQGEIRYQATLSSRFRSHRIASAPMA